MHDFVRCVQAILKVRFKLKEDMRKLHEATVKLVGRRISETGETSVLDAQGSSNVQLVLDPADSNR